MITVLDTARNICAINANIAALHGQARRKHFLSGTATGEGSVQRCVAAIRPHEARENFFHLHFSVVWIGCRSTFVLCTALLTAEYAEGDRAQLEGQQRPQAL